MIHIKFFAHLRENLGHSDIKVEGYEGKTVSDIKQALIGRGDAWQTLGENDVLCAVNQSISAASTIVNDGDELAFFPPVTGG
jgi:molybdopterin synthase sulfur carrier subunit